MFPATRRLARGGVATENRAMDDLAALRLQVEWGVDEALAEQPVDRLRPTARQRRPALLAAAPAGPTGVIQAQALAAAAGTLAELRDALAGFEGCALRMTATNLVFADGDPAARLVLVADVPGAAEDRTGLPFAGPAGLFLDRMFASAGLDRMAWRATSMLPWRPPGDRKPTEQEIQLCLPFLHRHLQLLRPRRAVLVGNLAARSLLPGSGRRPRATWHEMTVPGLPAPIPTLALPSLMHIHATAHAKRDAWADLLRLRRVLDADAINHD